MVHQPCSPRFHTDECLTSLSSTQRLAVDYYRQTAYWTRRTRDRCLDYDHGVDPAQQKCVRSTTRIILFFLQLYPHVDLHENCTRLRLRKPNQITNLHAWGSRPVLSNVVSEINCEMPYVVRRTIADGQIALRLASPVFAPGEICRDDTAYMPLFVPRVSSAQTPLTRGRKGFA